MSSPLPRTGTVPAEVAPTRVLTLAPVATLAFDLSLNVGGHAVHIVQFSSGGSHAIKQVELGSGSSHTIEDVEFSGSAGNTIKEVEFSCGRSNTIEDVELDSS